MSTRHVTFSSPATLTSLARLARSVRAFVAGTVATLLTAVPSSPPPVAPDGRAAPRRWSGASGQATTEYALILLAAALVGLLVVAWATAGGAAGRIGQLFDTVVDSVISRV